MDIAPPPNIAAGKIHGIFTKVFLINIKRNNSKTKKTKAKLEGE